MINTTSRGLEWRELSPFFLGPVKLYEKKTSRNVENGWQYSKVYLQHAREQEVWDDSGFIHWPTSEHWEWANAGWSNPRAVRYPMGKGAIPLFSFWKGERLTYLQARKRIYVPLYSRAVAKTDAWERLKKLHASGKDFWLWDFDGYDHVKLGMSLKEVRRCKERKMGHAFVLAMMLQGELP